MTRAFTLVELSIVLVILGLLTGGVLTGQSLIRAAEVRKHVRFIDEFKSAWNTFRDKYMYVPGDMPNATSFWGRSSLAGDGCLTDSGTASATGACNGNGNGKIEWNVARENYQVFYHLYLAGLMNAYAGTGSANAAVYLVPPGPAPGRMFVGSTNNYAELYANATDAALGASYTGNAVQFAPINTTANAPIEAYLKPEDAWNSDTKIDDGKLQSGEYRASNGYIPGTTTAARAPCAIGTNPNYDYNLTYTDVACKISARVSQ